MNRVYLIGFPGLSILISVFDMKVVFSCSPGFEGYNVTMATAGHRAMVNATNSRARASWARQAPGFNAGTNTDHLQENLNIVCTFSNLQCEE